MYRVASHKYRQNKKIEGKIHHTDFKISEEQRNTTSCLVQSGLHEVERLNFAEGHRKATHRQIQVIKPRLIQGSVLGSRGLY